MKRVEVFRELQNNRRQIYIFSIITVFAFVFAYFVLSASLTPSLHDGVSSGVHPLDMVCVYHFSSPATGHKLLSEECNHNLLYDSGANITRDALIGATGASVTTVSLCNATSNGTGSSFCFSPLASGAENFVAYNACGLQNATGTATVLNQKGNWTVSKTFTSTCDSQVTNVTRLMNATVLFAGSSFTSVTLLTNDQLTINWTLQVS